jgi:hypothetical protein
MKGLTYLCLNFFSSVGVVFFNKLVFKSYGFNYGSSLTLSPLLCATFGPDVFPPHPIFCKFEMHELWITHIVLIHVRVINRWVIINVAFHRHRYWLGCVRSSGCYSNETNRHGWYVKRHLVCLQQSKMAPLQGHREYLAIFFLITFAHLYTRTCRSQKDHVIIICVCN